MTDPNEIAFRDQLQAATNEAVNVHHKIGQKMKAKGVSSGNVRPCETGPVVDAVHAWQQHAQANGLRHCPHINVDRPEPIFALLAVPGYVGCHACSLQIALDYTEANPWTCDSCGNEPADHVFQEVIIQMGPAIVAGNVCVSCYERTQS